MADVEEGTRGDVDPSGFHYRAQEGLFDAIRPDWPTFLTRLLNKHDAWLKVALKIYPIDPKADAETIEAQKKGAVKNLRRTLEEHLPEDPEAREAYLRSDKRPRHFSITWLAIVADEIPGAGIDIAHFAADSYGTERGAAKVDTVKLKEEFDEVREVATQVGDVLEKLTTQLGRIGKQLDRIEKGERR